MPTGLMMHTRPNAPHLAGSSFILVLVALALQACASEPSGASSAEADGGAVACPDPSLAGADAAPAAAADGVPGITGCSGTYACGFAPRSGAPTERTQQVILRVADGECWAADSRLLPNGALGGRGAGLDFWIPTEGGFRVERSTGMETCTTTTGSSRSGPKMTQPYCHGSRAQACAGMQAASACASATGCAWRTDPDGAGACALLVPDCYARLTARTCVLLPGCAWK